MSNTYHKYGSFWLFMLGLGSMTKVYLAGVIAFSELVMFAIAPLIFFKRYNEFRRSGVMPLLLLPFAMIAGCVITCLYHGLPMQPLIKSVMMFYSIFAAICVYYVLLKENPKGLWLYFLGAFFSSIISIFVFDPRVMVSETSTELIGQLDLVDVQRGPLFWFPKTSALINLPVIGGYLRLPLLYPLLAMPLNGAIAVLTSSSSRGPAAQALLSLGIILLGKKSRKSMRAIGRNFWLFAVVLILLGYVAKNAYVYSAKRGFLGREAEVKYNNQIHGNDSMLGVLMGGRAEFFIAIKAMLDEPIIGIGPYAEDKKGLYREHILKYGNDDDYTNYLNRLKLAGTAAVELVPQHSGVTQFWATGGISGLIFWLYVFYLIYLFFRKYSSAIPQWYGYFAIAIPSLGFSMVFNPYTQRTTMPLLMTCLLLARAIGSGKVRLPVEMEMEARKYD